MVFVGFVGFTNAFLNIMVAEAGFVEKSRGAHRWREVENRGVEK